MPHREAELINWILQQARNSESLEAILAGAGERLVEMGVPLAALGVGMPTINPKQVYSRAAWWRDGEQADNLFAIDETEQATQAGPIGHLIRSGKLEFRWNLDDSDCEPFPLFDQLRARGATEYALRLVQFSEGRTTLRGAAMIMVSDRPGGFSDRDLTLVTAGLPALSLAAYRIGLFEVATETLSAYLGRETGSNVLHGMIRRGDGRRISAALMLADLRGFTALVDSIDAMVAVELLNEHLEAIGDPVTANGGEVLKFLGDGLLAVFPVGNHADDPAKACAKAIQSAIDARAQNAALNNRRRESGQPQLDLNLVLHFGEVVYGNIGTATRLDFTVIGRAVNEASRMEALGKSIGQPLLLSESFARRCKQATFSLGSFPLRGVQGEREFFVVDCAALSDA